MDKTGISTVAKRVCRQCGIEFMGGPRAWYCPNCRRERAKEANRRCKAKQRLNGHADRPLGSIDKCTVCGADYVVQSARQKYCKKCAPEQYKIVDREQGRDWLKVAVRNHGEEYLELHRLRKKRHWQNNKKANLALFAAKNWRLDKKFIVINNAEMLAKDTAMLSTTIRLGGKKQSQS